MHLTELYPTNKLSFQFKLGQVIIGHIQTTVQQIFGSSLTGEAVKTFPLSEIAGGTVDIQLSMHDMDEGSNGGRELEFPGLNSKCPYLQKISLAHKYEREAQEVLARLRDEIGDFLGAVEEEGLQSGGRSPLRARSPTKSPLAGGNKSPYRRKTGREMQGVARVTELPSLQVPSRFGIELRQLSAEETHKLKNLIIAFCEKIRLMKLQILEIEQFN